MDMRTKDVWSNTFLLEENVGNVVCSCICIGTGLWAEVRGSAISMAGE